MTYGNSTRLDLTCWWDLCWGLLLPIKQWYHADRLEARRCRLNRHGEPDLHLVRDIPESNGRSPKGPSNNHISR